LCLRIRHQMSQNQPGTIMLHRLAAPISASVLVCSRRPRRYRQLQICRIIWSSSSCRIARGASGVPSSSASISRECPAASPAKDRSETGCGGHYVPGGSFFREINPSSRPYPPLLRPRRRSVPVPPGLSLPVLPPTIICVLLPGTSKCENISRSARSVPLSRRGRRARRTSRDKRYKSAF
jgi:hypothetical protein